ncbi:hypothetical protein [Borrelia sp. P9F1]|uniref:hypothetical protein n=1 Tax=Borrelia sp. P9F1 TaxID=3058374 RepID=UPI00264A339F|nr:hypothetical protein [Borrelia sp. P9F1]WKC58717.1 hypothetical protein QYZ68_05800 [Borrelia sp. P9F1]
MNRIFLFAISLGLLSCDVESLRRTKEVAGEVRSILENGGEIEFAGYADVTVTKEKIDGVEVAVLSGSAGIGVISDSGDFVEVAVAGSGSVSASGRVEGQAVVSSKVETEKGSTGSTNVYSSDTYGTVAPVSGYNDATEITEDTAGTESLGGYSGESNLIEEEYYGSPGFGISYGGVNAVVEEDEYDPLNEAKASVNESLKLVKKLAKDYNLFSYYQTIKGDTRRLGEYNKKRKAAEEASKYTRERLDGDLDGLLASVKKGLDAANAGERVYKSSKAKDKLGKLTNAKKQLVELEEEVEKFVGEVKTGQETDQSAYGTQNGTRQGKLLTMEESLKKVKKLLYGSKSGQQN